MDLRENIIEMLENALECTEDYTGTWYYPLGDYNGNRWAVCASYQDYDNDDNWKLYAKIGYQSLNNIMQCDYDIDWEMPYDPIRGDVYDTELCIGDEVSDIDEANIDWLLNEWEHIKAHYIDDES